MAHNTDLESLLDRETAAWPGVAKKAMFGGRVYVLNGNMCAGIWRDFLIGRVGPGYDSFLKRDSISPMDITGKPMKGWIKVDPKGWARKATRDTVLSAARAFVTTLEPRA